MPSKKNRYSTKSQGSGICITASTSVTIPTGHIPGPKKRTLQTDNGVLKQSKKKRQ